MLFMYKDLYIRAVKEHELAQSSLDSCGYWGSAWIILAITSAVINIAIIPLLIHLLKEKSKGVKVYNHRNDSTV